MYHPLLMYSTAGLDARNNRVKINLPTNRDSYGHSETTVGKLLKRHIQSRWVFFVSSCSWELCVGTSLIMDLQKKDPPRLNASRRDRSDGGLGSVVTISVGWQINLMCFRMARATKYKFTGLL